MTVRVGINGFGRIGRNFLRAVYEAGSDVEIVGINDLTDNKTLAHLLKYDSILGRFGRQVEYDDTSIMIDGKAVNASAERDPSKIGWGDMGADVVIESTGVFRTGPQCQPHLDGGAKKVIISAPAKDVDGTFVMGINDADYDPATMTVISNASCTTNCLAPMVRVLLDSVGVERGLMTTIHAYTNDQPVLDFAHSDLRRARGAATNQIPTSTGAAAAIGLVIPEMKGKLDGYAMRVPVPTGSATDLTFEMSREGTAEEINAAFKAASESGPLAGKLVYTEDPIVSSDIVTSPASVTIDALTTKTIGTTAKVLGWYDNEWGYSNRLIDISVLVGNNL